MANLLIVLSQLNDAVFIEAFDVFRNWRLAKAPFHDFEDKSSAMGMSVRGFDGLGGNYNIRDSSLASVMNIPARSQRMFLNTSYTSTGRQPLMFLFVVIQQRLVIPS